MWRCWLCRGQGHYPVFVQESTVVCFAKNQYIYNSAFSSSSFFFFKLFSSMTQLCLTLRPQGQQQARPPCPSTTPRVFSNSCPLSQWCHPTISSSVVPFSSCPQSLTASGSFQMSQLFASNCIRWQKYWSFGFNISPSSDTQDWFPLGWTGWISLLSRGLLRVFSNTTVQKHQFFGTQLSL